MVTVAVTPVLFRRRSKVVFAFAGTAVIAYALVPRLVERHIRASLVDHGFPHAELDVAGIGLGGLRLRNVHLDDGLELGTVDIEPGLALLWRGVENVSIDRASLSASALARHAPALQRSGDGVPFRRARIANSTLEVGATSTTITGTATAGTTALDVTISIAEPSAQGWSVEASGKVVLGDRVDVNGNGTARIPRVDVGPYTLEHVVVPFEVADRAIRLGGTATFLGGELTVDPVLLRDQPLDVVVRARGIQLDRLLAPTRTLTGRGLVDGAVALQVAAQGWSLLHGELHTRSGGTLQISDTGLRHQLAEQHSPFALHKTIAAALADFEFDVLALELAPPGTQTDLRLSTRGRGRTNHQELDVAIAVHGARKLATRLPGAMP